MSVSFKAQAALLFMFLSFGSEVFAKEKQILITSEDMTQITPESIDLSGKILNNLFGIRIRKEENNGIVNINIYARFNDKPIGEYKIPLNNIPRVDLNSVTYFGYDRPVPVLKVKIPFGERRECFINDDGRDSLTVVFASGRSPEAVETTFAGCELRQRTLRQP